MVACPGQRFDQDMQRVSKIWEQDFACPGQRFDQDMQQVRPGGGSCPYYKMCDFQIWLHVLVKGSTRTCNGSIRGGGSCPAKEPCDSEICLHVISWSTWSERPSWARIFWKQLKKGTMGAKRNNGGQKDSNPTAGIKNTVFYL